ncbi:hypothetical protein PT974_10929 [Cladobotryum mycophilum]|uniref:Uncharacterized protein n=1 Tax=Cladobotryum mycophilum TaxID=491253 RepID=A0ABR0SB71_9HYPO
MVLNVYQIEIQTSSSPHHIIYVETGANGTGIKFHVKRVNSQEHMVFSMDHVSPPGFGSLSTFKSRDFLGRAEDGSLGRIERVCRTVTPPTTQYDSMGTCNCLNWVNDAVAALERDGVIRA